MPVRRLSVSACRAAAALLLASALVSPRAAQAYSVLSHEEVVDMVWTPEIVPMLKQRYPGITSDQIRQAHAYAYGGSVIQDIGYYPFGSEYFSNLLHYVRPNDFVTALIRDSKTPDEYAFALGALAHFCGDTLGHPVVNQVTAEENPPLRRRFGHIVTYGEDPTAHIRTEFGFDVVEVAHGLYSQQNYHDFIGFQVAKPLLEQAFQETYGVPMNSIIKNEDLAIGAYRNAVSALIPEVTRIAFVTYRKEIEKAAPGTARNAFRYRFDRTQYHREFGNVQPHVGLAGRLLAFIVKLIPKVGPFRALKVSIANAQEQDLYLKSINSVVDQYKLDLAQVHAAPAPLPPVTDADAKDARNAADVLDGAARRDQKLADRTKDPDLRARREKQAAGEQQLATRADANATEVAAQAKVQATQPATPLTRAIASPSAPKLADLDLDTGRPSAAGEYPLADETYAQLLHELTNPAPRQAARSANPDPALVSAIEHFFAHPAAPTAPETPKQARKQAAQAAQIQTDLATLHRMPAASAILQQSPRP